MKKVYFLFLLLLFICCDKQNGVKFKDGDIIFHISKSAQSKAIQLATKSKYSHMGIIVKMKNKWYVYEAISTISYTPLLKWISRGIDNHYVVKRLNKNLSKSDLEKMKQVGLSFKGKKYDQYFEWSDDKIYCSELVWKIYNRALRIKIGELEKFKDFDLSHPLVKSKLKEKYDKIPLDEIIISPKQIFNSSLLKTIIEN